MIRLPVAMLLLAMLLLTGTACAEVPSSALLREGARAAFGGAVPSGWRPTFRVNDLPVPGRWTLHGQRLCDGPASKSALVSVEVDGRVVRRVPIVFTLSSSAPPPGRDAAARTGEPGRATAKGEVAVRRGETVRVVARRGGVACEMSGQALADAQVGQVVSVRCGRRVLSGRAASGGEVEVGR